MRISDWSSDVCSSDLLADPQDTVEYWRARCRSAGLGGLHVAGMETFGFADPRPAGFDSAVEFFPHGARGDDIGGRIGDLPAGFSGRILDYASVAARALERGPQPFRLFRGVLRSDEHTSDLQSLMRILYAVFF